MGFGWCLRWRFSHSLLSGAKYSLRLFADWGNFCFLPVGQGVGIRLFAVLWSDSVTASVAVLFQRFLASFQLCALRRSGSLLANQDVWWNQKVLVFPRFEIWSPMDTGMVDSLVFRLEHFLANYICGVLCGTFCAVIVVLVAWNVQFGFPPNDFSFRLLWRRSVVLWLGPVRVCPVVVRLVLGMVTILFAGVGSLTLQWGRLRSSLWGAALVSVILRLRSWLRLRWSSILLSASLLLVLGLLGGFIRTIVWPYRFAYVLHQFVIVYERFDAVLVRSSNTGCVFEVWLTFVVQWLRSVLIVGSIGCNLDDFF